MQVVPFLLHTSGPASGYGWHSSIAHSHPLHSSPSASEEAKHNKQHVLWPFSQNPMSFGVRASADVAGSQNAGSPLILGSRVGRPPKTGFRV